MEITMEGRYALRSEPNKEVRVLCVDADKGMPGITCPVVVVTQFGGVSCRYKDGTAPTGSKQDLVPYQPPVERWGVVSKGGTFVGSYADEPTAQDWAKHYCGRLFKMVEVRE